jgi:hypothetical protein
MKNRCECIQVDSKWQHIETVFAKIVLNGKTFIACCHARDLKINLCWPTT